jgi:hypothetical protein
LWCSGGYRMGYQSLCWGAILLLLQLSLSAHDRAVSTSFCRKSLQVHDYIPNYMVLKNPLIILYSFNVVQRLVLQIFLKLVVKQETFCYIGISLVLCTPQYFHKIFFLPIHFLMPTKCIFSVLICTRCYGGLVNNFCCRTSDDGTCRIWDALDSSRKSRVYMPSPKEPPTSMMILLWSDKTFFNWF